MEKIKIDTKIYPMEAIRATAYGFLDDNYIHLRSIGENEVEATIKIKSEKEEMEDLGGEFINELLNNALRLKIAERNKDIRKLIVQQALYAAVSNKPFGVGDNNSSYQDDPLGIAVPWEEKYGEEKN